MRKRVARPLVAVMVAVLSVGVSRAATPAAVAGANRALAIRTADGLIDSLALPSDAAQSAAEPGGDHGELARGVSFLFYRDEVDRVRFWLTAVPPSQVLSSIAAHVPAGATHNGRGWEGGPDFDSFQSWSLPTIDPADLGQRLLAVRAAALANGQTGVRADMWIQYLAPRPAAQRVPAQARVLDITVTQPPSGKIVRSLQVTNVRTVRRIAAVIDGLPLAGGPNIAISCPVFPSDTRFETFRLRATATGTTLATVGLYAATPDTGDPCADASLWIRGHRQAPLADGGVLLGQASAILQVKLADSTVYR